jgi:hypothetical protein
MRVSLAPKTRSVAAVPLLDPRGARVVLGAQSTAPVAPIAASPSTLFGPRSACLGASHGPLIACDTGHHRLLIWKHAPEADNASADVVIGQRDFHTEGRNAGGEAGRATLNVPTGVAVGAGVMAVADAWNHRVLLWHGLPRKSNQPADVVLGQADFSSGLANRGLAAPRADTLHWCYGVAIHDGRLHVADTGNRRVLVWEKMPQSNGVPADLVLGHRDFTTRDADAMRWPHGIAAAAGKLFVADAGKSELMVWNALPRRSGVPCDSTLAPPPTLGFGMPYGLAARAELLVVADTANSRLLGLDLKGASMWGLAGQPTFGERGDNRWRPAARDSLCWPYGVAACESTVVIADSGNNRILLWEAA